MNQKIALMGSILGAVAALILSSSANAKSAESELFVNTVRNILDMNELVDFSVEQGLSSADLGKCQTVPAEEALDLVINEALELEKQWIRTEQKADLNQFLTFKNQEITFCLNQTSGDDRFHFISTYSIIRESDQDAVTLTLRWIDGGDIDEP